MVPSLKSPHSISLRLKVAEIFQNICPGVKGLASRIPRQPAYPLGCATDVCLLGVLPSNSVVVWLWWIVWPSRAAEVGHDFGVPTRVAATPFHRLAMAGGPTNCHLLRMGRILGEMLANGCSPRAPFSSSSRSALADGGEGVLWGWGGQQVGQLF
ncbi:hypothetical protein AVEN_253911-1 [Araneus ventricosus]|uniref:Uncharacterized protein n=1 Tax=Araneus ventricosus TaxID=182803 RepID=A0A4Y2EJP6_ARAVE|nr:hypothetical protein AVEN_253911-1 [Araneus ventricosus]